MASSNSNTFRSGLYLSLLVGLCVIVLGAFVRLSDAGLGCPDWPGCYGHLIGIPDSSEEITSAKQNYPQQAFVKDKAWKEMIHRYLASFLGLLILGLSWIAWRNRHNADQPVALPIALLGLVILQGMLGMWTVTLKLNPVIVLAHLLGGLTIVSLLWWLILRTRSPGFSDSPHWTASNTMTSFALLAICLLIVQIMLGGWVSANYAALACTDFPTCQEQFWPKMDFSTFFPKQILAPINYEHGILDSPARTAIHMVHRIGALVTVIALLGFFYAVLKQDPPKHLAMAVLVSAFLLLVQASLGISNVLFSLPIAVATAHNGVATLLLLSLLFIAHEVSVSKRKNLS